MSSEFYYELPSSPDDVVDLYNSVLRDTLDSHAPEMSRMITLCPHAPWCTDELRAAKFEKRHCKRVYRTPRLAVHKDIFHVQCRIYNQLLVDTKTKYYKSKIDNTD